jgi:hypothetical protein
MVTLLPQFTHYAVPSKAVSAVTMGKPILFCGNRESDNWSMFRDSGWFIKDDEALKSEIEAFCMEITKEEIRQKATNASTYSSKLNQMVLDSYHFIGQFISSM